MEFESGVSSYVVGSCMVYAHFPVDMKGNPYVRCELCEYFSRNSRRCRINNAICEWPDRYVSSQCPLNFTNKGENENEPDFEREH